MATDDIEAASTADAGQGGSAPPFSRKIIDAGFVTGLILAVFCLSIAGWYLISYQLYATSAYESVQQNGKAGVEALAIHIYMARVLLQSCGLAVGMAFGFLGFSLFLLGISGNMDANAQAPGGYAVQVARISPGAFIMLCSTILVGICATKPIPTTIAGGAPAGERSAGPDDRLGIGAENSGSEHAPPEVPSPPAESGNTQ